MEEGEITLEEEKEQSGQRERREIEIRKEKERTKREKEAREWELMNNVTGKAAREKERGDMKSNARRYSNGMGIPSDYQKKAMIFSTIFLKTLEPLS